MEAIRELKGLRARTQLNQNVTGAIFYNAVLPGSCMVTKRSKRKAQVLCDP